jgi:hypothetical protein
LVRTVPAAVAISEEMSEEFDTDVKETEILARGSYYSVGTVRGTTWKALVLLGAVVFLFGIALELMTRGYIYPIPEYLPTPLGSGLILTVPIAGFLILIVGIALRSSDRADPPIEPIV